MRTIDIDIKNEVINIHLKKGEYGKDCVYFNLLDDGKTKDIGDDSLKLDVWITPRSGVTITTIKQGELYLATINKKVTDEIDVKKALLIIENQIEDTREDYFAKIFIEE